MTSPTLPPNIPPLAYDKDEYRHYLPEYGPGGAGIMLMWDYEHEAWRMTDLQVHPDLREQGLGNRILTIITDWADACGHRLLLFAEPIGNDGPTTTQLIRWYKRYGFTHMPRKHQSVMIRQPKGAPP